MDVGVSFGQSFTKAGQTCVLGVKGISFGHCLNSDLHNVTWRGEVGFPEVQPVDTVHAKGHVGEFPDARRRDVGKERDRLHRVSGRCLKLTSPVNCCGERLRCPDFTKDILHQFDVPKTVFSGRKQRLPALKGANEVFGLSQECPFDGRVVERILRPVGHSRTFGIPVQCLLASDPGWKYHGVLPGHGCNESHPKSEAVVCPFVPRLDEQR